MQATPTPVRDVFLRAAVAELGCTAVLLILPLAAFVSSLAVGNVLGALFSGVLVLLMVRGFARGVRRRFGIRVVPRFRPPLSTETRTYFSGREILLSLRRLDTQAEARGVLPLSVFLDGVWQRSGVGADTVAVLLLGEEAAVLGELELLLAALEQGVAEGCDFRLEVLTGTSMNGQRWSQLRAKGYG